MLWAHALRILMTRGSLTVIDAHGQLHQFGDGSALPGIAPSVIRLHDKKLHWKLVVNPGLYVGEAYMNGALTIEAGTLRDFLATLAVNMAWQPDHWATSIADGFDTLTRVFQQYNPVKKSVENVQHHYDLSDALYTKFLDPDMQYSCAYFAKPGMSLDDAQQAKKHHIAAKLKLEPGMRVLDIGCGWGGMALTLARDYGVHVTGLTLSNEQHAKAVARVVKAGLEDQIQILLRDYRDETGQYDRIVSVGMFEHVGVNYYREFFKQIRTLLKPDGVALLHSIGRVDGPGTTNPWLRKYIFPGGYAPALSEVVPVVERSDLWITDIEILRMHYAHTLDAWHTRFQAARAEIAALYDERFCRMWEFYLLACEMEFRYHETMVFQMQLTRTVDALPITRDYMMSLHPQGGC